MRVYSVFSLPSAKLLVSERIGAEAGAKKRPIHFPKKSTPGFNSSANLCQRRPADGADERQSQRTLTNFTFCLVLP